MYWPENRADLLRARYRGGSVCITGGAGFIGGHLAEALLLLGAKVNIIDDLSCSDVETVASLVDRYPGRARFVYASILEPGALAEAIEGCDCVFHLAALSSVPRSVKEPERCLAVNAVGTLRVLEAAREAGLSRVVYAASSSAYGESQSLPLLESAPAEPVSPYGAAKLAGEHLVRSWCSTYGLCGISLRYFNVFGPRQAAGNAYSGVVAAFCRRLLRGEQPVIYGDGSQTRDFIAVGDVVHANLLAGALRRELKGEAVNIGSGRRTSLLELLPILARLTGRADVAPIFKPARAGDVPHSQADLTRARGLLGFEPFVDLETGLAETLAWLRGQGSASLAAANEGGPLS